MTPRLRCMPVSWRSSGGRPPTIHTRQSDAESVIEAASRFPLSESDDGVIFEPGGFQEMILFIEELPW